MEDRGILDNYLNCTFAFIINLMNKEPQKFKTVSFPAQQPGQQPLTALDLTLQLGQKSFEVSREKEDEIWAINVVTLFNSILENLQDVSFVIPGIVELVLGELKSAQTPDYQIMLLQGILTCLWYDMGQTVSVLEAQGAMDTFFQFVFQKVSEIREDFEVKRFVLGLTALLVNSDMPASVKSNYANTMKALAYLSSKSIEIRHKNAQGKQRAEEAEVEDHGEQFIVEDEEDTIIDIDSDDNDEDYEYGDEEDYDGNENMYDSPLDNLDEVLNLQN